MHRPVTYHPEAVAELREAYRWYRDIRPALGEKFFKNVRDTIHKICEQPLAYPVLKDVARCKRVSHFPYNLIFIPENENIRIIAAFHDSRDPQQWIKRL